MHSFLITLYATSVKPTQCAGSFYDLRLALQPSP